MRLGKFLLFALAAWAGFCTPLLAQAIVANVNALRVTGGGFGSSDTYIFLEGYFGTNDGGGGTLVRMNGGVNACQTTVSPVTTNGTTTVTLGTGSTVPSSIALGMGITGDAPLGIPSGDTVTAFTSTTITLAVAAGNSMGTSYNAYLSGDNGGTIFKDTTGYCFQRINSTYNQVEWGALGNGTHDDTSALQNWINANQPHIAVPGNSIISNTLYCGYGGLTGQGVIQGSPATSSGADGQPTFLVTANDKVSPMNTWGGGPAMFVMNEQQCALSAVGMIGNPANTAGYDIVEATQKHNTVFNHSLLSGGNYGFRCQSAGADTGVYDSSIVKSALDGVYSYCPNSKFQRNVISGAGGNAITFGGSQALIEDNVIEQSGGNGVHCVGGVQLGIVGNYFDDNGKTTANTSNVRASGCQVVSIAGNQFHRGSAFDELAGTTPTAQVWLDGANDGVAMAGNTNYAGSTNPLNIEMRPDYDLELGASASVTNFSYADSPTPQNMVTATTSGIFGPNATASLGPYLASLVPHNFLSGLITQNGTTGTQIAINPGTAADSTNIQLMALTSTCTTDLSTAGVGGLDTGAALSANTTYNFFLIAQGGYNGAPLRIASTGASPNFYAASLTGHIPAHVGVSGYVTSGSNQIMNVTVGGCTGSGTSFSCPSQNPFGGLAIGDYLTDTGTGGLSAIPANTQITALNSANPAAFTPTLASGVDVEVGSTAVASTLYSGMVVGNAPGGNWLGDQYSVITYVQPTAGTCGTVPAPCFEMTAPVSGSTSGSMQVSGGFTITMSNGATVSSWNGTTLVSDAIKVYNDRYRLVASLLTAGPLIRPTFMRAYHQDNDSFYFDAPTNDVNATVGTSGGNIALASVPTGISVEAFGRCIATSTAAGYVVFIYTPTTATTAPTSFPTAPGYSIQTTVTGSGQAVTALPYRLYTNTTTDIAARASATSTLQCITDGFVWPRGR